MSFISNEQLRRSISMVSGRCFRYGYALLHKEFADWLWRRVWLDDIPGRAAQLSYYFLLSLFPLLICLSALLGYFFAAESRLEQRLLQHLGTMMPKPAFDLVMTTADDLLRTRGGGMLSFGLLTALWLASSGMEAVIETLVVGPGQNRASMWHLRRLQEALPITHRL
ncbi:MAG: YihY/virulence factor BrkB family protein [Acidobacteria bacterium]|nr:YihY/virulence factor BrkB family protein [Acidobacteriota bacterium]